MKLAYSTNGFTRVDLSTAIRRIAHHGYGGVELLADTPHWTPATARQQVAPLRRALRETGLFVSNVNANTATALWSEVPPEPVFEPSLSNSDAAVRAERIHYTRACLELGAEVGAGAVSVTSGRVQSEVPPEEGMRWFAESLSGLAEYAASLGVRLSVEYEPGLLVENSTELRALLDTVGHPALGANLDLGHAICAFEDPVEAIHRLRGRIWNVHLEDLKGRKHYHLIPGQGDVDFDVLLDGLEAVAYDGPLTVELYTCAHVADDAAAGAFTHLSKILRRRSLAVKGR